MKKRIKNYPETKRLRQNAEEVLTREKVKEKSPVAESEILKLNNELSIHQIELELQNEELLRAKEDLEVAVEKYSDLYDFAPTGYVTLTNEGQILGLNHCASKMLGKERQRLIKTMFGAYLTPGTKLNLDKFLKEIFKTRIEQSCEIILSKKDNSMTYAYLVGHASKDCKSCDISMIDITERKDAERKLSDLLNMVTVSNKELEDFAYVASHDLQEPLRMVTSFIQLLSIKYKDKLDDTADEYIRFAAEGAKRMYDLLNGLLAYSRVQTKGKAFIKVNINHVLINVLNNLALKIEERGAVIKSDKLPVLYADETQMTQLFQNLIENSLKFTPRSPRIYISSKCETDRYTFSVKDEGLGIEPQYFERIFQIFQRLLPREQYEGTGAGLAICKRIVERHGGRIWVESEIEKGSTFFFTILMNVNNTI
jgi:two-component system, chemotaxis family, sensor kinase Cph1